MAIGSPAAALSMPPAISRCSHGLQLQSPLWIIPMDNPGCSCELNTCSVALQAVRVVQARRHPEQAVHWRAEGRPTWGGGLAGRPAGRLRRAGIRQRCLCRLVCFHCLRG